MQVRRGAFAGRARAAVPEPLAERLRLLLARHLETSLRGSPAVRGAALVFHAVAPRGGDPALEIDPPLEVRRLDAVVDYLTRRYQIVRAAELPAAVQARKADDPVPIALTFDDDLACHREHAAPVLRHHGAVATAFLCGASAPFWWQLLQTAVDNRAIARDELPDVPSGMVGEALERQPGAIRRLAKAIEDLEPPDRDRVGAVLERAARVRQPLLGPEGTAALVAAGWEIGFHTRRHDVLTGLDEGALRAALEGGRDELTGTPVRTLAYPHGKATAREARAARDAGYVAAYTGRAEVVTERTDFHLIGRLQPDTVTRGRFALDLARALAAA